jgi:hypothetical protein
VNAQYVLHALSAPSEQSDVVGALPAPSAMTVVDELNTASHIASAERLLPMANS